jgi:hypothetical protein
MNGPRIALLFLALALLACTLSLSGGDGSGPGDESGNGAPVADASTIPTVRIVAPTDGQQVPVNQRVDITVETDSTATTFLLSVNGRVAGTTALPDQSGPTSAILTWTPTSAGSYTLEVRAQNGTQTSIPVAVTVQASGTASSGDSGSGSNTGACTGRVLVTKLNFRNAPNTDAVRLGQFQVGETVTVVGRNAAANWWQVQRTGEDRQVWVFNNQDWMRVEGGCGDLPVSG